MEKSDGRKDNGAEEHVTKLWNEELERSSKILAKVIRTQPPEVGEELAKLLLAFSNGNLIPKDRI
ncbi:hypothetical protein [Nitrosovibrio sp. Nv6]|uniref:hypothetical protein n=1 Tax=Nitrosovibrio sp. Nv6 TaxID=1855340 RepID=UPI0008C0150B|nr:hypothetical protein [Nitrosovibrio sp. Nv6]SEO43797.1 hypothetical protein SAMN05216316_0213 [Nitrosovibrio sp. Nv6]